LKENYITNANPTQYEQEIKCMKERLTRCLQLLKINHDDQISKTAFELIERSKDQATTIQEDRDWINALNTIADSYFLNQRVLSQAEVYDFLTVSVTTSLDSRTKAIDDMIFRIYRDIMANYESSDNKLKVAYPKIIVDVVAILAKGTDTSGKKIPIHNVEAYYQNRKSDISTTSSSVSVAVPTATSATATSIKNINRKGKEPWARSESIDYEEKHPNKDEETEIVESLNKITDRSKKDIQASIAKLERRDIERIKDLCKNYNKLQKYSKLITDADNLQKFRTALQNETGKKLSDHQLRHAVKSIRKVKLYIENVLDGKFIPHGSYGINHTKHNLEYGYLIVGLMQPSKRRVTTTTNRKT
jgi:hypothetical protein